MRIWDIPTSNLCRKHLLGEHRELHAIWIILTSGKKGYSNHPETKRWKGKLAALYKRHEDEVEEIKNRNYIHKSDLDKKLATGNTYQDKLINSIEEQINILRRKNCDCYKQ
jgi:hypothetical protein